MKKQQESSKSSNLEYGFDNNIQYCFDNAISFDSAKGIEKYQPNQQIALLIYLFNNKILDDFISSYEFFQKTNPQQLLLNNKQYAPDVDLHDKYLQMKHILEQTTIDLGIAKGNNQGWSVSKIDQRCFLAVRTHATQLQLKSRGVLHTNIKNIVYLAYLVKLYHQCLPFCKESIDLKEISQLQKLAFIRFSLPLINDRCTYLRGIGFDRLKKSNSICIYAESVTENKQFLQKHSINTQERMKKRVPLDLKHFVVELTYRGKQESEYTGYALVDHHMKLLPEFMVKFVVKEMAKFLFEDLMKKLLNFQNTVWAKEVKDNYKDNQSFYKWLDIKIAAWQKELDEKEQGGLKK